MKVKAFGKMVSRKQAYKIIIYGTINEMVHGNMYEVVEDLLVYGGLGFKYWTSKDLEEYICNLRYKRQLRKLV